MAKQEVVMMWSECLWHYDWLPSSSYCAPLHSLHKSLNVEKSSANGTKFDSFYIVAHGYLELNTASFIFIGTKNN